MIVCHCYGVSDREIRKCAREGAQDLAAVGRHCGAGTGCGGCRPELDDILESEGGGGSQGRVRLSIVSDTLCQAG
jgi:bacterioferritin-associated ferredoxin